MAAGNAAGRVFVKGVTIVIASWASEEMSAPDLGDERLERRAELLLSRLGARPNLSIPAACKGKAEIKAAYAFFDNDKVTFDKVLEPHRRCTRARMAEQEVVLLVQMPNGSAMSRSRL